MYNHHLSQKQVLLLGYSVFDDSLRPNVENLALEGNKLLAQFILCLNLSHMQSAVCEDYQPFLLSFNADKPDHYTWITFHRNFMTNEIYRGIGCIDTFGGPVNTFVFASPQTNHTCHKMALNSKTSSKLKSIHAGLLRF